MSKQSRRPKTRNERREEEQLWLVRYLYKKDLAELSESGNDPLGYAVFRASDEAQVCQKLTTWLRLVLHEEAQVESVELLPPNALICTPVNDFPP